MIPEMAAIENVGEILCKSGDNFCGSETVNIVGIDLDLLSVLTFSLAIVGLANVFLSSNGDVAGGSMGLRSFMTPLSGSGSFIFLSNCGPASAALFV